MPSTCTAIDYRPRFHTVMLRPYGRGQGSGRDTMVTPAGRRAITHCWPVAAQHFGDVLMARLREGRANTRPRRRPLPACRRWGGCATPAGFIRDNVTASHGPHLSRASTLISVVIRICRKMAMSLLLRKGNPRWPAQKPLHSGSSEAIPRRCLGRRFIPTGWTAPTDVAETTYSPLPE